jgi:hypothetical protein
LFLEGKTPVLGPKILKNYPFFHTVENYFPWRGKIAKKVSMAWKIQRPKPPQKTSKIAQNRPKSPIFSQFRPFSTHF